MLKRIFFILLYLFSFSAGRIFAVPPIYIADEPSLDKFFKSTRSSDTVYAFSNELLLHLDEEKVDRLKEVVSADNITVAGTTYSETLLPILIEIGLRNDALGQILIGKRIYDNIFGSAPVLFYPYRGLLNNESVAVVKEAGYDVLISTAGDRTDIDELGDLPEPDITAYITEPVQIFALDCIARASLKVVEYTSSSIVMPELLNAALEELYFMQKISWYENYLLPNEEQRQDNDLWFRAGISNIYRMISIEPPSEILVSLFSSALPEYQELSSPATGQYTVYFEDCNDEIELSSSGIIGFGICSASSDVIKAENIFRVIVSSFYAGEEIDIYIDLNGHIGAGSTEFLPGHQGFTDEDSAWEYAISLKDNASQLFKYQLGGSPPYKIADLPVSKFEYGFDIVVPEKYIKGDPAMWGYVVAGFGADGAAFDILGYTPSAGESVIQVPALRK